MATSTSHKRHISFKSKSGRNRVSRKVWPVAIFFGLLLAFAYLKTLSLGGVDIEVYKRVAYLPPSEWGDYHKANFVSWYWIYIAFTWIQNLPAGYSLALIDLLLWSLFFFIAAADEPYDWRYAILSMISFAGVLLSYNILRQYIAVVLILCAAVALMRGRKGMAALFTMAAVFSHYSTLFFIVIFIAAWLSSRIRMNVKLSVLAITVASYAFFTFFNISKISSASDLGDGVGELIIYAALAGVLIFGLLRQRIRALEKLGAKTAREIIAFRFFTFSYCTTLIIFATGAPIWLANRILISIIFLTLSFALCIRIGEKRKVSVFSFYSDLWPLAFMVATIFLHPGAFSMLSPQRKSWNYLLG